VYFKEIMMQKDTFEDLVLKALAELPLEFQRKLENVDIVVEDYPTIAQLDKTKLNRNQTLLGLYEGVPLTKRGRHYNLVPPDKITVFRKPIESRCRDDAEVTAEIQRVVRHEIAHHFGTGEQTLRRLETGKAGQTQEKANP
jgi:predicted Zn-dependent protease with MMP-like domain